jgi:hypothetical protein
LSAGHTGLLCHRCHQMLVDKYGKVEAEVRHTFIAPAPPYEPVCVQSAAAVSKPVAAALALVQASMPFLTKRTFFRQCTPQVIDALCRKLTLEVCTNPVLSKQLLLHSDRLFAMFTGEGI